MNIELIVLSYLGCDSGRYLSSLAFCAFAVFMRGLPALVVCLAGAVEAGRSPSGNGMDQGTQTDSLSHWYTNLAVTYNG